MTDVKEIVEHTKKVRETQLANNPEAEFLPTISVIRDDLVQLALLKGAEDIGDILAFLPLIKTAFGPDMLIMATDSYMATGKGDALNIPQGKRLSDLFEEGRKDLISEAMVVNAISDDGLVSVVCPYEREGSNLTWGEEVDMLAAGAKLTGRVPDSLRHAWTTKDLLGWIRKLGLKAEDFELTDKQARDHADMAGLRALSVHGWAVCLFSYDDDRTRIIKESLARQPDLNVIGEWV